MWYCRHIESLLADPPLLICSTNHPSNYYRPWNSPSIVHYCSVHSPIKLPRHHHYWCSHKEVKYNGHAATVDSYFEQPNAPSSSEENTTTHRRWFLLQVNATTIRMRRSEGSKKPWNLRFSSTRTGTYRPSLITNPNKRKELEMVRKRGNNLARRIKNDDPSIVGLKGSGLKIRRW